MGEYTEHQSEYDRTFLPGYQGPGKIQVNNEIFEICCYSWEEIKIGMGAIVELLMKLALTIFLVFSAATGLIADEIRGKVVSIADGDTITVLDADKHQHKIRLEGIDAPEKKQAFGTKSRQKLGDLVAGKDVTVQWTKKDRYSRIVGHVYLGDRDIDLEMVKAGMAWHYRQYSKSTELAAAEAEARKNRVGLWVDTNPVPPWEFRKTKKK